MTRPPGLRHPLFTLGIVLGLVSGLVEGVGHMALHRLNVLDNSWYPIIWIAAVFNGLLIGLAGLAATVLPVRFAANAKARATAIFSLFFLAIAPVLALMLKEWIYTYAIALLVVGLATVLTRWHLAQDTWWLAGRRALQWSVGLTIAAFVVIEGGARIQERNNTRSLPEAGASVPDVLLIVVDTLRADHLASYGYSRVTSPKIDALAAGGVLFEHSFATSSYTLPSHVSILSGQSAIDHGVEWSQSHRWPASVGPLLPEVLQSRGYRTGAFSANTFYFSREHGFGRGFLHFEDYFHSLEDRAWRTAYGAIAWRLGRAAGVLEDLPARKRAPDVSRAASRWIAQDPARPFFVTLNYMDAHDPYLPPQPYRNRFSKSPNPGGLINSKVHIPRSLSPDQIQSEIDAYDGGIAYADDQIARLLADIEVLARGRPLLVIVTSDHGEEFGEHGGFLHQHHLYREVIQVPLIVWQPGTVPAGQRVARPVSNAAIPATVMDLIGADPVAFPTPSLRSLWTGASQDFPAPRSDLKHRPWAFPHDSPIRFGSMRSLVDENWHYIDHDTQAPQLFDRRTDPQERSNVAASPNLLGVVVDMKRRISAEARRR